MLSTTT